MQRLLQLRLSRLGFSWVPLAEAGREKVTSNSQGILTGSSPGTPSGSSKMSSDDASSGGTERCGDVAFDGLLRRDRSISLVQRSAGNRKTLCLNAAPGKFNHTMLNT